MRTARSSSSRGFKAAIAILAICAPLAACASPVAAGAWSTSPTPTADTPSTGVPSPVISGDTTPTASSSPNPSVSATSPTPSPAPTTSPTEASPEPTVEENEIEPILTYVGIEDGQLTANAVIPYVVEEGGRCVFTVMSNGAIRNHTTDAIPDAQSTLCAPLTVPTSSSESTVTVRYESQELSIQSDPARAGDNP